MRLDFADNLIEAAVAKGYREARGESSSDDGELAGPGRFHKEPGEPLFVDLAPGQRKRP